MLAKLNIHDAIPKLNVHDVMAFEGRDGVGRMQTIRGAVVDFFPPPHRHCTRTGSTPPPVRPSRTRTELHSLSMTSRTAQLPFVDNQVDFSFYKNCSACDESATLIQQVELHTRVLRLPKCVLVRMSTAEGHSRRHPYTYTRGGRDPVQYPAQAPSPRWGSSVAHPSMLC